MRTFFLLCALALLAGGLCTYLTQPEKQTEVPIIYWVIDPAPARPEQIALYHKWLVNHGYGERRALRTMDEVRAFRTRRRSPEMRRAILEGNADGPAVFSESTTAADLPLEVVVPGVEMRLDSASNDLNKKLVQGLSGVGGDVIEAYSGGKQMQYLAAAGMLADVTESARELGFGPDKTYPALAPSLFYDGRQYAFPRNPAQTMYWVNKDTFAKYGQPLPPSRWTVEEFEAAGRAFMAAANPDLSRPTVFFADRAMTVELRRSFGLSMFNETMTRCTLDDPRNAEMLELVRKWTYEDRILPTAADRASFESEGGWGGATFQLFKSGRFGLFASGRWALMLFRKFGAMPLAVVEPPYRDVPNTILSGGQSTVYVASEHRRYAELFLAYMAGEDYNMQIVRDGDALPPNPAYTETELFLRPPDYPNEWGCHEAYATAAKTIAITQSFSPFVLPVVVERYDNMALDQVLNDIKSPQEAADEAADRVNREIELNLRESADLKRRHAALCALQGKIDRRLAAGLPVPANWILNPFHARLYEREGKVGPPEPEEAP